MLYFLHMAEFLTTNPIVTHPSYAEILHDYNEILRTGKKVSQLKFHREVVSVKIPTCSYRSWHYFIKKLENPHALPAVPETIVAANVERTELSNILLSNQQATEQGLQAALNIGSIALRDLFNDPIALARMPKEKLADLMFKAMKAQDSRVHAIGRMKDDRRAEEKFNRLLNNGTYKKDGPTS